MQTHDFLKNVYEKSMCCDLKAFVLLLLVFVFPGMVVHREPLYRLVGQMGDGEQW